MTVGDSVLLVALILGVNIVLWGVILFFLRRKSRRVGSELREDVGGEGNVERMENVLTFGLRSRGKGQVRGNGSLALAPDALVFRQWVPQRDTRVPLDWITEVTTKRSWLGKSQGVKLLVVHWREPGGAEDAMAWRVADLEGWLAALGGVSAGAPGGG